MRDERSYHAIYPDAIDRMESPQLSGVLNFDWFYVVFQPLKRLNVRRIEEIVRQRAFYDLAQIGGYLQPIMKHVNHAQPVFATFHA